MIWAHAVCRYDEYPRSLDCEYAMTLQYPTIADCIGNTPLVRLQRLAGDTTNTLLLKLEGNNPAGSVKDRPALSMIARAEGRGQIQAGDTLYVNRAPQVYVYGEVQRAGAYRIERQMTVLQALALGGGLSPRGTERGIRIHRRGEDGAANR